MFHWSQSTHLCFEGSFDPEKLVGFIENPFEVITDMLLVSFDILCNELVDSFSDVFLTFGLLFNWFAEKINEVLLPSKKLIIHESDHVLFLDFEELAKNVWIRRDWCMDVFEHPFNFFLVYHLQINNKRFDKCFILYIDFWRTKFEL